MGHLVRIIIPDDMPGLGMTGNQISVVNRIATMFGGCTTWEADGAWVGIDAQVESEKVLVCECSIYAWTPQVRGWWLDLAADIARTWDQDCVYLSVREETTLLVSRHDEYEIIGHNPCSGDEPELRGLSLEHGPPPAGSPLAYDAQRSRLDEPHSPVCRCVRCGTSSVGPRTMPLDDDDGTGTMRRRADGGEREDGA